MTLLPGLKPPAHAARCGNPWHRRVCPATGAIGQCSPFTYSDSGVGIRWIGAPRRQMRRSGSFERGGGAVVLVVSITTVYSVPFARYDVYSSAVTPHPMSRNPRRRQKHPFSSPERHGDMVRKPTAAKFS
ncbi:hypothetical protein NHX12_004258 [Muraenolepis orangiensis]|uniref:Uncharacterized protein n=1 Tax=Muraenolepis orangiensis TaxID=630683 RepID=A0A9Q0DV51_9TELE|nr:hypothetical protein NHX12_004258 [Muraenolepis orangiensis]